MSNGMLAMTGFSRGELGKRKWEGPLHGKREWEGPLPSLCSSKADSTPICGWASRHWGCGARGGALGGMGGVPTAGGVRCPTHHPHFLPTCLPPPSSLQPCPRQPDVHTVCRV